MIKTALKHKILEIAISFMFETIDNNMKPMQIPAASDGKIFTNLLTGEDYRIHEGHVEIYDDSCGWYTSQDPNDQIKQRLLLAAIVLNQGERYV